jgi:hypothetical protein
LAIFRHETACNNRYRLGCFVLAFMFPMVRGTAVFCGMLAGEAAIFATAYFTDVSWLWYNVIGCVVVVCWFSLKWREGALR